MLTPHCISSLIQRRMLLIVPTVSFMVSLLFRSWVTGWIPCIMLP